MPVLRNPFRKSVLPNSYTTSTTAAASTTNVADQLEHELENGYPTVARKAVTAITILEKPDDGNTYKLSVVNDSGVYLPPSPTESRGFWTRTNSSSSFKNRPPVSPSDEQFTISRESFDSYRRSFDISARSPISDISHGRLSVDTRSVRERVSMDVGLSRMSLDVPSSRMSLDSGISTGHYRSSSPTTSTTTRLSPTLKDVEEPENDVEDLKLNDNPRPKKLGGIFSRFGSSHDCNASNKDSPSPRFKTNIFGGGRRDPHIDYEHESELKNIVRVDNLVG